MRYDLLIHDRNSVVAPCCWADSTGQYKQSQEEMTVLFLKMLMLFLSSSSSFIIIFVIHSLGAKEPS